VANLWKVFLDDSGDEKKQRFIAVGSLLGDKAAWNDFNKSWRKALHAPPLIEHFHYKEFIVLDGQFRQFRDKIKWPKPTGSEAANEKRQVLEDVILNSSLCSHGLVVDVPGYIRVRNTAPNAKLFLGKDPWGYAIQEVALEITRAIIGPNPKAQVSYVSDDSSSAPEYTKAYINFKEKNPKIAKSMLGLSHLPDEQWYGLQAADLIASAVKQCYDEKEQDDSEEAFFKLVKKRPLFKNFVKIGFIDEMRLRKIVASQTINKQKKG
jgi:hypothetical protein